ncbi:site-specific DNA-methyltransferase (cytosine-N4-specific) [Cupriavidus alkaliphilus]|uniref:DNA-methyltransferase n=1 Tax=Cupriavidus alkaliphilus TaxID=942866 RepID=UPI000DE79655|nr:site-specific DNA-methyltransferase [Cupriavidus alkaliphilus]PVY81091.1 site-specific DNA-methyltransferase (cytosine-N4-specific) [Cupriavidus alkaliphilus]
MTLDQCYQGDCRAVMRDLIAAGVRVQCIVTSPPYWGLRDYGHPGQIGQEPTLRGFLDNMVEVFDLCRELLSDDGTLWLNMGDSYASNGGPTGPMTGAQFINRQRGKAAICLSNRKAGQEAGLKPKDLVGQPWRLAFALQDAGWWLRQDIVWHKPNPMPESVRDRCTKAHEYLFLMTRSERYYFDADAIKEPATYGPTPSGVGFGHGFDAEFRERGRIRVPGNVNAAKGQAAYEAGDERHRTKAGLQAYAYKVRESVKRGDFDGKTNDLPDREAFRAITEMRNKRSVWMIATQPYAGAHFATFPESLVEPCILAGSRPGDIVFDPFMGSGTVASVAQRLGRRWIGAELNPDYIALQAERTRQPGLVLETSE